MEGTFEKCLITNRFVKHKSILEREPSHYLWRKEEPRGWRDNPSLIHYAGQESGSRLFYL